MSRRKMAAVGRIGLGSVFYYAGFVKILNPARFYRTIEAYGMTGERLSWGLSHYLPWLELITGSLLVAGVWKKQALEIGAALLVLFIPALLLAWSRGLDMTCGCFGNHPGPASYATALSRDLLLLTITCVLWRAENKIPRSRIARSP